MLRSTAQHGSASNVILILYFTVFKTGEAWFNLGLSITRYLQKHLCISKIWAFHLWVIDCYKKNLIETKVFNSVRGKCTVFSFCMVDSRLHWMFETKLSFPLTDRELLRKVEKNFGCYWCYFCTLNLFSLLLPPYLLSTFSLYLSSCVHLQPVLILSVIMII